MCLSCKQESTSLLVSSLMFLLWYIRSRYKINLLNITHDININTNWYVIRKRYFQMYYKWLSLRRSLGRPQNEWANKTYDKCHKCLTDISIKLQTTKISFSKILCSSGWHWTKKMDVRVWFFFIERVNKTNKTRYGHNCIRKCTSARCARL